VKNSTTYYLEITWLARDFAVDALAKYAVDYARAAAGHAFLFLFRGRQERAETRLLCEPRQGFLVRQRR